MRVNIELFMYLFYVWLWTVDPLKSIVSNMFELLYVCWVIYFLQSNKFKNIWISSIFILSFFPFSYRNCGVTSKVQKLMQLALDKRKNNSGDQRLNLADDEWEIRTISSAVKVQKRFQFKTSQFAQFWTDFPAQSSRAADDIWAAQPIHQCR